MIAIGNFTDTKELIEMAKYAHKKCSKAGGSVIFESRLEADIAIARIDQNLAAHWRKRFREAPRRSYPCGKHWHVTKN